MIETKYQPFNFSGILQLINEGEHCERKVIKNGERCKDSKVSGLYDRFQELYEKNPDSWECEQFKNVNQAPDRTYDTIRSTLAAKFSNYSTKEIEKMMSGNDFDFAGAAQQKTIIFVLQSDCDRSMDGLVNLFFPQKMSAFIRYADSCPEGRLPIPVRFFLDDYGATTNIYNLNSIISTIRSRNISVSLILQVESQLMKGGRGEDTTIISNCDTYIYMGSNDIDTAKSISVRCNKPLEKILYMPVGHCWIFTRGQKPVYAEISDRPVLQEKSQIQSLPDAFGGQMMLF